MTYATILLLTITLLLVPVNLGISMHYDLDKRCIVVLILLYQFTLFHTTIAIEGDMVTYNGSVNGSVKIVDLNAKDCSKLLKSFLIRRIKCHTCLNMCNFAHINVLSSFLALATIASDVVNITDVSMQSYSTFGESNYVNISLVTTTTPLSLAIALGR